MQSNLSIGPVTVSSGTVSRVSADVDGRMLWFETPDASLTPAAEAFGGALLLSALDREQRIDLADPVCPLWYGQMPELLRLVNRWWDYPRHLPDAEIRRSAPESAASGVGLCFTGGVDSFYSLLHSGLPIDTLIYVLDYDVPPGARHRLSEYEIPFRNLCRELGVRAVVVRSNLREHPAFQCTSWKRTHGAALVAVGHLLSNVIGRLVISSSYSLRHRQPWGSHWDLDPLWSSSRLQVVHFGERLRRMDKVRCIVDDLHVRRYLRPCWENPPGMLNCSECEKCVRTQLAIDCWSDLSQFEAFDHSLSLVERVDRVRKIPDAGLISIYQDFLDSELPDDVKAALARLMRRSRWSFTRKRVRRRVREMWRMAFWGSSANRTKSAA